MNIDELIEQAYRTNCLRNSAKYSEMRKRVSLPAVYQSEQHKQRMCADNQNQIANPDSSMLNATQQTRMRCSFGRWNQVAVPPSNSATQAVAPAAVLQST